MSNVSRGKSPRNQRKSEREPTVRLFNIGQRVFQRFTLQKVLGRGGMGIVWLAFDGQLEREVALKFLPEVVFHDHAVLDDLKRETRRSLELTHPNIVRTHDFIQDSQAACISMEYIDGDDLSALRQKQSKRIFECPDLESWIEQWGQAMGYAHGQARVVHCDLKPANLMLTSRGVLKVADFGIARSLNDSVTRLSLGPRYSGTLVYMSPQQLDGEKPTPLDDIYSMGATLYELLTSKPPFYRGQIDGQIREKTAPSVAYRRAELDIKSAFIIPTSWEETLAACLAKDPSARPQTASEVVSRLGVTSTQPQGKISSKPVRPLVKGETKLEDISARRGPDPSAAKARSANGRAYRWQAGAAFTKSLLSLPKPLLGLLIASVIGGTVCLALLSSRLMLDSTPEDRGEKISSITGTPGANSAVAPHALNPAKQNSSSAVTVVGPSKAPDRVPLPTSERTVPESSSTSFASQTQATPPSYRISNRKLSPSGKLWIEFREYPTSPRDRIYLVPCENPILATSIFAYDGGNADILMAPDEHALVINRSDAQDVASVHLLFRVTPRDAQDANRFEFRTRIDNLAWDFYRRLSGLSEEGDRDRITIEATVWEPDSRAVRLRMTSAASSTKDPSMLPLEVSYRLMSGDVVAGSASDDGTRAVAVTNRVRYRVSGLPKNASKLNIRESPSSTSRIVGSLGIESRGIVAESGRVSNGSTVWQEVSGQDYRGWVNSQYIKADQSAQAAQSRGEVLSPISTEEQAEVIRMITVSNDSARTRDVNKAVSLYSDQVDLFDEGLKNREQIAADIRRYFIQWPSERMDLRGPVTMRRIQRDQIEVRFTIGYEVSNPSTKKGLRGTADVVWTLVKMGDRMSFAIISHKEKLISRTSFALPNRLPPARTTGTPSSGWRTLRTY